MDSDNKLEYMQLLENYFPFVIAEMISSYVGKYNLFHVNTFDKSATAFIKNMVNRTCDIKISPGDVLCIDNIDENIFIYGNVYFNYITLFNVKRNEIIKKILIEKQHGKYFTTDGKYIVLGSTDKLNILDIDENKIISTIRPQCSITYETTLASDIIYIVSGGEPKILKYTISGSHIKTIQLKEIIRDYNWSRVRIRITKNEFVISLCQKIIFCDLDGNMLGESSVTPISVAPPFVTNDYVCIVADKICYRYKRMM
jgi:hypothetical protein